MLKNNLWMTRAGNFSRNGNSDEKLSPPLTLCWKRQIAEDNLWSSPIIADGLVYIADGSGLKILNVAKGEFQWQLDGVIVFMAGSPTLWESLLIVAGKNRCHAININTRKVEWYYQIDKLISHCAPAVVEDKVIWGAVDGLLRALDIKSGELVWQFNVQDWIKCAPTVYNNTIYFGTEEGSVYAINASEGKLIWERQFSGTSTHTTIAFEKGKIVVCIKESGVFALDAQTGKTIWHHKTPYGPWAAPSIKDDVVFVADWNLNAVRLDNGQHIWTSEELSLHHSSPIIAGDTIFIGGGHRPYVYGFDRHTGEKVWEYKTGDIVFSTPAVANGKLFICSHDGFLYCFEEA